MTLDQVKALLKNDKNADKEILATLIEENSKSGSANTEQQETIKNATMLLLEMMDDKEREEFTKNMMSSLDQYDAELKSVDKLIADNKLDEALDKSNKLLIPYLDDNYPFKENDKEIYVDFPSILDFFLYKKVSTVKKEIKFMPLPMSYVLYQHAYILMGQEKYDDGRNYLSKALDISPLNFDIIFMLIDSYKVQGDLDTFYVETCAAMPLAHHSYQVAKLYRNVAYFAEAKGKFDVAGAALLMARQFSHIKEDYDKTVKEIEFVESKLNKNVKDMSFDDTMEILKNNNVPLIPSDGMVNAYSDLLKEFKEAKAEKEYLMVLESKVDFLATKEEKEEYKKLAEEFKNKNEASQNNIKA